jgi:hypothetical protein
MMTTLLLMRIPASVEKTIRPASPMYHLATETLEEAF